MLNAVVDGLIRIPASGIHPKALALIRRELTFTNPEYVQRVKFDRWVGATPEELCLVREGRQGRIILPRGAVGVLRDALARVGELVRFVDRRHMGDSSNFPFRIELRDYQAKAVAVLVAGTQGCAVLPCGAGKTIIGVGIISKTGQPAIIMVHTKDLLEQWTETIRSVLGVEPGIVAEGVYDPRRITIAMVQSLAVLSGSALASLGNRFGQLLVDECVPGHSRVVLPDGTASAEHLFQAMESDDSLLFKVLSYSHTAGVAEFKPVSRIVRKTVRRRMVTLRARASGSVRSVQVTEDHPVYVIGRGYVPACQVQCSDKVLVTRAFFPCQRCSYAGTTGSGLGGHMVCAHGNNRGLKRMQARGGRCRYCGRLIANHAALKVHERRHEDEDFDRKARDRLSRQMRATNLAHSEQIRVRMQDRNPMSRPEAKEKVRAWHKCQPRHWYARLDGGNGQPPTKPEAALLIRLSSDWIWQYILPTAMPRETGYPPHYKLDLACLDIKLAVEVDGKSHQTEKVRAADARKEALLVERGWTVLRFWNQEILDDPEGVVQRINEATDELRCS